MPDPSLAAALVSGGAAGTAVDVSLFPLDTLKTRLQSQKGFWAAGGFKNVYHGIGPAAAGSAPGSAIFFLTYEAVKRQLGKVNEVICHQITSIVLITAVS